MRSSWPNLLPPTSLGCNCSMWHPEKTPDLPQCICTAACPCCPSSFKNLSRADSSFQHVQACYRFSPARQFPGHLAQISAPITSNERDWLNPDLSSVCVVPSSMMTWVQETQQAGPLYLTWLTAWLFQNLTSRMVTFKCPQSRLEKNCACLTLMGGSNHVAQRI